MAFGPDVTERFLELNNLELVIRSHEVKMEGVDVLSSSALPSSVDAVAPSLASPQVDPPVSSPEWLLPFFSLDPPAPLPQASM